MLRVFGDHMMANNGPSLSSLIIFSKLEGGARAPKAPPLATPLDFGRARIDAAPCLKVLSRIEAELLSNPV